MQKFIYKTNIMKLEICETKSLITGSRAINLALMEFKPKFFTKIRNRYKMSTLALERGVG